MLCVGGLAWQAEACVSALRGHRWPAGLMLLSERMRALLRGRVHSDREGGREEGGKCVCVCACLLCVDRQQIMVRLCLTVSRHWEWAVHGTPVCPLHWFAKAERCVVSAFISQCSTYAIQEGMATSHVQTFSVCAPLDMSSFSVCAPHDMSGQQVPALSSLVRRYMNPLFSCMVGGVLPFGAVFIELFFILTSMWLHQVRGNIRHPLQLCHAHGALGRPALLLLLLLLMMIIMICCCRCCCLAAPACSMTCSAQVECRAHVAPGRPALPLALQPGCLLAMLQAGRLLSSTLESAQLVHLAGSLEHAQCAVYGPHVCGTMREAPYIQAVVAVSPRERSRDCTLRCCCQTMPTQTPMFMHVIQGDECS